MKSIALLALLAIGCNATTPAPLECIDEPGAPCCVPPYDLATDGCPQDGQTLSTLSDAWRCLTADAFDGPWVEHDGGRVTAYGHESQVGVLRTSCGVDGRVEFVSEAPAGEAACVSACYGDACDGAAWCSWAL